MAEIKKQAVYEGYKIYVDMEGSVHIEYDGSEVETGKTKSVLREISEKAGFSYEEKWNTRQLGGKLIGFLNEDNEEENYPVFDFVFKKIDWELNDDNIENLREEIYDAGGVVVFRGWYEEGGDFDVRVLSGGDIADMLYDVEDVISYFSNRGDEFEIIEVFYSTVCEAYGTGFEWYDHDSDMGYVLSEFLGSSKNGYDYEFGQNVLCKLTIIDSDDVCVDCWMTDEYGNYAEDVDEDMVKKILSKYVINDDK